MNCYENPNIKVGEYYKIVSEDGLRSGHIKVTFIDRATCEIKFLMMDGNWMETGIENEKNVKLYYGPGYYITLNKELVDEEVQVV